MASQTFNRNTRWDLRDSIYVIDNDSVRRSVGKILDLVFHDSAWSPRPSELRYSLFELMYYLGNDSVNLRIVNMKQDTVPFVLKRGRIDSTAFFLVNSKMDSARVFIRSLDKNSIYMWVGDDLTLTRLLKRPASADRIPAYKKDLSTYRIPRKKVPVLPPKIWDLGSEVSLMVNQVSFSNWAKGGNNSMAFTTDLKGWANYSKGNIRVENGAQFLYGIQKIELSSLRKSQDRIELKSSLNHKAFNNYEYSLDVVFYTQLFKGYHPSNDSVPVSKIMAPGYFLINLGMDYKPNKDLRIKPSPIAFKFTSVLDTFLIDQTKYGLTPDQRVRPEFGWNFYGLYKTTLFKNINLNTELRLFANYMQLKNIDVDWRLSLDLKVNKYLSTSIKTQLIWDYDVLIPLYEVQDGRKVKVGEGKRVQFMELLGISFKYIF